MPLFNADLIDIYYAQVFLNTGGTAAVQGATTVVPYDTATVDNQNSFNTSTGVYTAPIAGRYLVSAGMGFTSGNPGRCILMIYSGGSEFRRIADIATYFDVYGSAMIRVSAGATLDIRYFAGTASGNLTTGSSQTYAQFEYLGIF